MTDPIDVGKLAREAAERINPEDCDGCDCHGYETLHAARNAAVRWRNAGVNALLPAPLTRAEEAQAVTDEAGLRSVVLQTYTLAGLGLNGFPEPARACLRKIFDVTEAALVPTTVHPPEPPPEAQSEESLPLGHAWVGCLPGGCGHACHRLDCGRSQQAHAPGATGEGK